MNSKARKRVLFVCVGNCCRSQMAEGFAFHHGSDILVAKSAGLAPAGIVVDETVHTMSEKNIDISGYFSKPFRVDDVSQYDLIVNMSGYDLPDSIHVPVVEWDVADPIGESAEFYAKVRDEIEELVVKLILELRRDTAKA